MGIHLKILLLFIFFCINSSLSSGTEWQALLNLRASLVIRARDWPKKSNPCLNWTGVTCENGHVIGINLSGLRRTRGGNLNPHFAIDSLQKFPLLSVFNSSGFVLRGSIPQWFGLRLSNLQVLDLRSSSIYGSIPGSLGSLNKLGELYLSQNSITGSIPTALGKLSSLSVLDVSHNLLTGKIPNEISALRNLSILDLSLNYLTGDIPLGLGSLSSLKVLNLSYNSLSGNIPVQLQNLPQLIQLDIGFNELSGSLLSGFFEKLYRLEYLDLHGNYFSGEISSALWSMSYLKYFDVSGNNLTGALFPNLTSSNVSGSVFNFSNNLLYGNLTSGIGKFHVIDVSDNYFQGSAPNNTGTGFIISNNCFTRVPGMRDLASCDMFYQGRGMFFENDSTHRVVTQKKSRRRLTYVMIGVFGGLGFLIVLISGTLVLLKLCSSRFKNNRRDGQNVASGVEGDIEKAPKVVVEFSGLGPALTYEQILLATSNCSNENLIKKGHSGDLFRGKLESGQDVVIKRIDLDSSRSGSFKLELDFFGKVSHPRLVPVMGHCLEDEEEKFLVYKKMVNGDLSNALYRLTNSGQDLLTLDWITRLKIAIGAAEALSYLHHECSPPVIHRDIQASSILLDDKYEVRLGSFSQACSSAANSSNQNVFARLLHSPQTYEKRPSGSSSISSAYDVYCFGKVLLELITGKLGISRSDTDEVKQWLESNLCMISIQDKEQVIKIIDQSLIIDEDLLEEVWAVALVAKSCLNPKASRRPSMRHVLKALENPFKVVRKEYYSSERLRPTSSRLSLAAAFYGSRQLSTSSSSYRSAQMSREIISGLRQTERIGSRGSGTNDHSSSHKRSSSDIFPEPSGMQDSNGTS